MINIKNALVSFALFIVAFQTVQAQKYSDAEIGFNRNNARELLLNDGVASDEVERKLVEHRRALESIYHYNLFPINPPSQSLTPCGNVGFQDDFSEWQLFRGIRDPQSGNLIVTIGDDIPGFQLVGFPDESGSQIFDSSSIDDFTIPGSDISPQALGLENFGPNFIRLGSEADGRMVDRITKTITVSESTRLFSYKYAAILEQPNPDGLQHLLAQQAYLRISLAVGEAVIPCSEFTATVPSTEDPDAGIPGFISYEENPLLLYRPVSTNSIDLKDPANGLNLQDGDTVTIIVEVADCSHGGHYGMAFFEGSCGSLDNAIQTNATEEGFCTGALINFSSFQESFGTPSWEVFNSSGNSVYTITAETLDYIFDEVGDYTVALTIESGGIGDNCEISFTRSITITDCDCECVNCDSFSPDPGEKYVISAWVHEDHPDPQLSFHQSYVEIVFLDELNQPLPFVSINSRYRPSGDIIDGWQRILGEFTIPSTAKRISFNLVNRNDDGIDSYFDDIRVHPFNSSMKSFVYDQQNQRLMAELDENNYATFYEYDKEGGLIRVKKETQKGIYTIQETRSGNSISQN